MSPARTTVAAVLALGVARMMGLPEIYWAPISTIIVVTQSDLSAALKISSQRLVGTALGSVAGALLVARFGTTLPVYAAGMFGLGLLCNALRLDRAAYRFAGITVTVIMLIAHTEGVWLAALHRFIEVSVGIAVGVIVTGLWPERPISPAVPSIKAPPG